MYHKSHDSHNNSSGFFWLIIAIALFIVFSGRGFPFWLFFWIFIIWAMSSNKKYKRNYYRQGRYTYSGRSTEYRGSQDSSYGYGPAKNREYDVPVSKGDDYSQPTMQSSYAAPTYAAPAQKAYSEPTIRNTNYCFECGSKTKSKDVFCKMCGTRL